MAFEDQQSFLLCSTGMLRRLAIPLALVARLEEIPPSRLEWASGRLMVQYRGDILPLISLSDCLQTATEVASPDSEFAEDNSANLQVIVVNNGSRSTGLVVDEILDIVQDRIAFVQKSTRAGLLGSAVIGGQITDLIDLQGTIQMVDPAWFDVPKVSDASTVLIADPSPFARGLLRTVIEVAGYRVLEAASLADARTLVSRIHVDAALLGADIGNDAEEGLSGVPVIALRTSGQELSRTGDHPDVRVCHGQYDREAMLHSLEKLVAAIEVPDRIAAVKG